MSLKPRINLTLPERLHKELSTIIPKGVRGEGWSGLFESAVRARIVLERARRKAPPGLSNSAALNFVLERLKVDHKLVLQTKRDEGRYEGWLLAKYYAPQHALERVTDVRAAARETTAREKDWLSQQDWFDGEWVSEASRAATDIVSSCGFQVLSSGQDDLQTSFIGYENRILAAHAQEVGTVDGLIHDPERPGLWGWVYRADGILRREDQSDVFQPPYHDANARFFSDRRDSPNFMTVYATYGGLLRDRRGAINRAWAIGFLDGFGEVAATIVPKLKPKRTTGDA